MAGCNSPRPHNQFSEEEFATGLGTYVVAHYSLVGWNSIDTTVPFPRNRPDQMPDMNFLEYLQSLGLGYLENLFT